MLPAYGDRVGERPVGISPLAATDGRLPQRYRVEGVVTGQFRSIAHQSDDPVYDTVKFAEVPSRLGRAAGHLKKWAVICRHVPKSEIDEVRNVIELCHKAATRLRTLVRNDSRAIKQVPKSIARDTIRAAFAEITVRGRIIGKPKAALKLIVKNVWDFGEINRRGIKATPDERAKSLEEIEAILATTNTMISKMNQYTENKHEYKNKNSMV